LTAKPFFPRSNTTTSPQKPDWGFIAPKRGVIARQLISNQNQTIIHLLRAYFGVFSPHHSPFRCHSDVRITAQAFTVAQMAQMA
jgi:hypothetical protein